MHLKSRSRKLEVKITNMEVSLFSVLFLYSLCAVLFFIIAVLNEKVHSFFKQSVSMF